MSSEKTATNIKTKSLVLKITHASLYGLHFTHSHI